MKQPTKKIAIKKISYLEIAKIYSISFILNKYETIKQNWNLFCAVCSNNPMNFIRTLPLFLYLQKNINKLSLQVVTSKNKKVIVITLTGGKKDYEFISSKKWNEFIKKFKKENGKSNDGFYADSNAYYYNNDNLQTTKFLFQLIILKNGASKKDMLEVKKDLLIIPSDTTCEFNKKGLYLNKYRDLKIYNCYDSAMILFGKSYFLPLLDPFLLSLSKLFGLTYSISNKILINETKKSKKEKISLTKKLLKISKKLAKKVSKKK